MADTSPATVTATEIKQPSSYHGWPKGVSGNPNGRPKRGETYKDVLLRLSNVPGHDARTKREAICARVFELAQAGESWAVQWIVERIEGKAAVSVNVSQSGDLLKGMTDTEILDMIDLVKQRRLDHDDNIANAA